MIGSDDLNEGTKDGLQKPQVGASIIDSEKETSNNLYSRTNIAKEFPDSVDACITGNISEPPTEIYHGNQVSDLFNGHMSCDDNIASSPSEDSAFPKSAQAFLDAIKKNRSCQKYLRSKLMQIESRIEENAKLRNSIKALKGFQFCCRRRTGLELSQKKDARLQLIQVPKLRVDAKVCILLLFTLLFQIVTSCFLSICMHSHKASLVTCTVKLKKGKISCFEFPKRIRCHISN